MKIAKKYLDMEDTEALGFSEEIIENAIARKAENFVKEEGAAEAERRLEDAKMQVQRATRMIATPVLSPDDNVFLGFRLIKLSLWVKHLSFHIELAKELGFHAELVKERLGAN